MPPPTMGKRQIIPSFYIRQNTTNLVVWRLKYSSRRNILIVCKSMLLITAFWFAFEPVSRSTIYITIMIILDGFQSIHWAMNTI